MREIRATMAIWIENTVYNFVFEYHICHIE